MITPDSFKESLSAPDVAEAIARGWWRVLPQAEVLLRPLADGGEGTVNTVLATTAGERHECRVEDPLGGPTLAHQGWLDDTTAVIEIASANGSRLVPRDRRDTTRSNSHGTGELIRTTLDAEARKIILDLSDNATDDAGTGLLNALGVCFLAADGEEPTPGGAALAGLHSLDLGGLGPCLVDVTAEVAVNVDNPLCGPRGASAVFGPQKDVSAKQVAQLDAALAYFARVVATTLGEGFSRVPDVDATGGLGLAARAFLRARFRPGVGLVAELAGLADVLVDADLMLAGEGRLDAQSLHGKIPMGMARIACQAGVPVVAPAGSLGDGYQHLHDAGIDAAFSLAPGPISPERACAGAAAELEVRAKQIARLWRLVQASREG